VAAAHDLGHGELRRGLGRGGKGGEAIVEDGGAIGLWAGPRPFSRVVN
jgi:hypothetical protein